MPISILVFAGSAREDSCNKKLARYAAQVTESASAKVTLIDLRDYPMPIYDGDLEDASGLPAKAKEFKQLLLSHDAFLIVSPEYNSSLPPLLKNAIDWASRSEDGEPHSLMAYRGKVAAIMAASPGRLGGLRVLVHLRAILENIGVIVIPPQVTLASAYEAFDDFGQLKSEFHRKEVDGAVKRLVEVTSALKGNARVN